MKFSERVFNILLGCSVLSWAVLGLTATPDGARLSTVRVCIAALNALIGVLFLLRGPLERAGGPRAVILALPSFLVCALAFNLAPPSDTWPVYSQIGFAAGTLFTVVSFLYLGNCFAVFPAVRGMVTGGPYRLVRHPAYAGEMLMVLACFTAGPSLLAAGPVLAALPLIALRIYAEEGVLKEGASYQAYTEQVSWRLVPGLW